MKLKHLLFHPRQARRQRRTRSRRGNILVLAASTLVMIFGFTAFSVDCGYIALTRAQLHSTSDAAAHAASMELPTNLGVSPKYTPEETAELARQAAIDVAAQNRAGGRSSVFLNGNRDVRFGQVVWDPLGHKWNKSWGVAPFNMVEVTARRDKAIGDADGPLPLFFAPVIGTDNAYLAVNSTAALIPGAGFRIPSGNGCTIDVLPIALDLPTWNDLIQNGVGTDAYRYNANGTISSGSDGVKEVDLYPYGKNSLPPGNRGTVDIGSPNNSTADLSRQIRYGLNQFDLSYFPNNELRFDDVPLLLNGDTGISAGIKDDLEAIKGQPRLIPIFTKVSGNGNNAMYTIVKFVGVRVMHVKLTGNPKKVVVQPCAFSHPCIVKDYSGAPIATDTIFTTPVFVD